MHENTNHFWYPRPVFFVADLARSLHFYQEQLGFTKTWHEGDGAGTVCQVNRSDCEIILCEDTTRVSAARLFIELTPDGLSELRRELNARSVPHTMARWGYDVVLLRDPDGNELMFPVDGTANA